MINKDLLEKIYDSAYVQRWNDKYRPVEFNELDKQAHKMTIAYLLGKFEENTEGFNWIEVIETGIFDFLQRLVLTDLKPQLLWKIKAENPEKYEELNDWVYRNLEQYISSLGIDFCRRYKERFSKQPNINTRIVDTAHMYASKWEFDFIERANPDGYEIVDIKKGYLSSIEEHYDLVGFQNVVLYKKYRNFIEFCGLLRFQYRWGHLYRVPRTSVLGHMLIVAILSYLFSFDVNASDKRKVNNYFTGLFHDLPEVLTRDVLNPIKKSILGLDDLIKEYEQKEMDEKVYPLIPQEWREELKRFTMNEFENNIIVDNRITPASFDDICSRYNEDQYSPRDGDLVKACDKLAAFLEANLAIKNGIPSKQFKDARKTLKEGKDSIEQSVLMKPQFGDIKSILDKLEKTS
jgi:putative hydrolase of HD superfamily